MMKIVVFECDVQFNIECVFCWSL